jgi:hypothetical protein
MARSRRLHWLAVNRAAASGSRIAAAREWIKNNKIASSIPVALVSFVGILVAPLQDTIKDIFWPQRIEIISSYEPKPACESCEINIDATLNQLSSSKIESGRLEFRLSDQLQFKDSNQASIVIKEFEGSVKPLDKGLSVYPKKGFVGDTSLEIVFANKNMSLSKTVHVAVVRSQYANTPRLLKTDTNRLDLSGDWLVQVGAEHGKMSIIQTPDTKIHGTYTIDDAIERNGIISGFKDGATFRVFLKTGNDNNRKRRVEGTIKINLTDNDFIEIVGCAYGLQRDAGVMADSESIASCSKLKNYFGWRGTSVTEFYAQSSLSK